MFIEEDYDADDILREDEGYDDDLDGKDSFNELNFEGLRNHGIDEIISDHGEESDL